MDLVDTDVLIDVQRGHAPALAWFGSLTELPAVPGFVVMELIQDARNATEVRAALKLVAPCALSGQAERIARRRYRILAPIISRTAWDCSMH
jgi:predicted nucleic acid-binding protein